jgi:hypothetical protein
VPFGDGTDARNLRLSYFDANSSVAKSRPIAPPQCEDAVGAGPDHPQEGVLGPFRVAEPLRASAKTRVSPICSSN